ncbi:hypothetical protein CDAR_559701 [Caerostris darwini]|uniref:Uncharacterized protein n=1 Tax=Caerostris darwini TaxID=1538125 RepID=A0AAV4W3I9_9ARAC|nr:hypothetical protein CDAR_559701 [Caerostris darwini]
MKERRQQITASTLNDILQAPNERMHNCIKSRSQAPRRPITQKLFSSLLFHSSPNIPPPISFSPLSTLSPLPTSANSSSAILISSYYMAPPKGSTTNQCENESLTPCWGVLIMN